MSKASPDKYSGAIFAPPQQSADDPATAFAEMTSTEPWTDAVTSEVSAWLDTKPTNHDARMLADALLTLARAVRADRADTLVNLGYAWCQWRVMAHGFQRAAGVGLAVGSGRPRAEITEEAKKRIDAGIGRKRLAKELGVTEKQARRMIDKHRKK